MISAVWMGSSLAVTVTWVQARRESSGGCKNHTDSLEDPSLRLPEEESMLGLLLWS